MRHFLIVPLALFLMSCQNDEMIIGSRYVDENMKILFTDTISVDSYTIAWDSVTTSGQKTFLTGNVDDPVFGNITSRSYVSMKLPTPGRLHVTSVFDSLQVILVPDGYYYGDTTKPFTVKVNRLEDFIDVNEGEALSNITAFEYEEEPLGETTFNPRPFKKDSVIVTLDNSLGQQLFNAFRNREDLVSEQSSFELFLKGLVINYDSSNEAVMGFFATDTIPVMRLYYHYFDFEETHAYIDFFMKDMNLQFNEISLYGQFAETLQTGEKIPARAAGNKTFLQAGTGIFTRLEIPYLKNILEVTRNIEILKAELVLEPAKQTYTKTTLPSGLSAFVTNKYNEFLYPITDRNNDVQYADLNLDEIFQEDTRFTFDVTDFINSKLYEQSDNVPALLITIKENDVYHKVDRIVFGSRWNADNDVFLRIYYMTYN